MAEKYSVIQQHQPLRVPSQWGKQEKAFVMQLEEVLDDIYRRFGRLRLEDLSRVFRDRLLDDEGNIAELIVDYGQIQIDVRNKYDKVSGITIDEDGILVTGSKYVKIASGGTFEVDSTNFKIDSDNGLLQSGSWRLDDNGLFYNNVDYPFYFQISNIDDIEELSTGIFYRQRTSNQYRIGEVLLGTKTYSPNNELLKGFYRFSVQYDAEKQTSAKFFVPANDFSTSGDVCIGSLSNPFTEGYFNKVIAKYGKFTTSAYVYNSTTTVNLLMHHNSNGSHGISSTGYWDGSSFHSSDKWLVYRDTSGNVICTGSASLNVLKAGDTMSGSLRVSRAGEAYFKAVDTNTNCEIYMVSAEGGTHGLISSGYYNGSAYTSSSTYLIYRNTSGNVIVNGSCTGSAGSVAWGNVTGKPSEYAPSDNSGYYTLWDGILSSLGSGTPAAATKTYWENSIPDNRVVAAYNTNGDEYTLLFSRGGSANYGNVIKFGYPSLYMYIIRRKGGSWLDSDWQKIYAGYADSAGSVAWDNVSSKPSNYPGGCTGTAGAVAWGNVTGKPSFDYLPLAGGTLTGTLNCKDVIPAAGYRVGGSGGSLYIGNSDNQSWVFTQDICSHSGNSKWKITIDGTGTFTKCYGAVWNDYAEMRMVPEAQENIVVVKDEKGNIKERTYPHAGRCVREVGNGEMILTTSRMQKGCKVISDTFGFCIGETDDCKTPIAVTGRVLAYPHEDIEQFKEHIGDFVCSGENGTISIMSQREAVEHPECIIGTISEVPDYEIWNCGNDETKPIKVDGRIWIYVR